MADFPKNLDLAQDQGAKSESYYCKAGAIVIDDSVIAWLKERLKATLGNTVRICLHPDASDQFHEMIIAHKRGGEFKPHKHLSKGESYHMIEGRLRVNIFDDNGKLASATVLARQGSGLAFMHRIPPNVWHSTEPDGDLVIFHESKPGPFTVGENVYPNWK